ncbi:hypothetical protein [Cryptosporangium japonicum]|uniref:Uncharacterized protein n=1 Tax=Cryptosporangium japonicum TaxID=80872 RepID=A0ABP3E4S0_9ACTN
MDAAAVRWTVVGWAGVAAVTFVLATGRDPTPLRPLTTPVADGTRIRHADPLTLTPGQGADLDAPAYDAEWGSPSDTDGPGTAFDVIYTSTGLSRADGALDTSLTLLRAPSACAEATGYGSAAIPRPRLVPGARICVRTGNGRVALVDVLAAAPGTGSFYVTTFAGPLDVP